MHWRIKGLAQKALGVLPAGRRLHYRAQRHFGGLRNFNREFAGKVDDWKIMVGHLRDAGTCVRRSRFFEIGTGWYPTFPFALYLAGAPRVITCDQTRHLCPDLTRKAVDGFGAVIGDIARTAGADGGDVRERHARLASALAAGQDLAEATGGVIEYAAPADATRSGLEDGAVDVVFSNSVLEHVPPPVVTSLYREARRILAPGGRMFHSVNCGDHYAYVDPRIHQLHYLKYSDRQWRFWNNRFLYQNRMRAHEFVDGALAEGFLVELDTSTPRPLRLEQLRLMQVADRFKGIPPEQLCITTVDFIARKPAA